MLHAHCAASCPVVLVNHLMIRLESHRGIIASAAYQHRTIRGPETLRLSLFDGLDNLLSSSSRMRISEFDHSQCPSAKWPETCNDSVCCSVAHASRMTARSPALIMVPLWDGQRREASQGLPVGIDQNPRLGRAAFPCIRTLAMSATMSPTTD